MILLNIFRKFNLVALLNKHIQDGWSVLDLGCGRNSPLQYLKTKNYKVGFDVYVPYVKKSKHRKIHNKYIIGDLKRKLPFKNKSFDCIVSTEVIEHLEKKNGLNLIKEMERVARKKIILTTPNGFLNTYAGPEDNPKENHLSGWTVKDFKLLGFEVRGLEGLRVFWRVKKGQANNIIGNKKFSRGIIMLMQSLITHKYPRLAFQLFAYKKINKK